MAWSVQQKGEGSPRDLIIIGHGGLTAAITAAAPRACVVGVTFPALTGGYAQIAPDKLPPLAEIVRGALGSTPLGSLVLIGFSEGCQMVRTYLAAGEVPSAVLVIDGAHGSKPEPSAAQLAPWRSFFGRARAGQRHAMITATRIPTVKYLPTAYMLPLIMGCSPAPLEPADVARVQAARPLTAAELQATAAGALRPGPGHVGVALLLELAQRWRPSRIAAGDAAEADAWEKGPGYWYLRDALAYAEQWPGTDAAAHVQQAKEVIPRLLGRTMGALADLPIPGWVKGVSEGPAPAPPAGVVWPTVPGASSPPPSSSPPASSPPGGRPPAGPPSSKPPASPPPPAPPAKSDGSGGAGVLLLVLTAGGVGLLTLKRLPAGPP